MMKRLFRMLWRLGKWLLLASVLVLPLLVIQTQPLLNSRVQLSADQANVGKQTAKRVLRALASDDSDQLVLQMTQQELDAVTALVSKSINHLTTHVGFNTAVVRVAATAHGNILGGLYLNVDCELDVNTGQFAVNHCELGDLPIPGGLSQWLLKNGSSLLFGKRVSITLVELLENLVVVDNRLQLSAGRNLAFKQDIKQSLKNITQTANRLNQGVKLDTAHVGLYLDHLEQYKKQSRSLAFFVYKGAELARFRSDSSLYPDADPVQENTALLWALAAKCGSTRFADMVGLSSGFPWQFEPVKLDGRRDLAQHFIYSAILEQVGRQDFALNIGEIKELMDSGKGGSGFSFADLAADKAGVAFALRLTKSTSQAREVQQRLTAVSSEKLFFPSIENLPEGLSEQQFQQRFGSVGSPRYQELASYIDQRIARLPLYSQQAFVSFVSEYKESEQPTE